jgi:hypothetical protein
VCIAFQTKPDDVLANDVLANDVLANDVLSKEGFFLTIPEIAQRLGISESAARALAQAALRNTRDECSGRSVTVPVL